MLDTLNRIANVLIVGAIFCTLMYMLIDLDAELAPGTIFGLSLLGTIIPGWIILR